MIYAAPGTAGAKFKHKVQYANSIGGNWVAPLKGQYFDVISPNNGKPYTKGAEDTEPALHAAHEADDKWGKTSPAGRANLLLKIADRLEANLELPAYAETVDNCKPIRETLNADIPLTIDYSAIWPVACARRKAVFPTSTSTRLPTISTNRWAWSGRSFRGIFLSRWQRGNWHRPSAQEIESY